MAFAPREAFGIFGFDKLQSYRCSGMGSHGYPLKMNDGLKAIGG